MVNLNRNNSNWSFEERRKINENWDILESMANSTASGNNGLKSEVDQLKVTVGQNTTRSTNALQTANQALANSNTVVGIANEATQTANEAKDIANESKTIAQGIEVKVDKANANSESAVESANLANSKADGAIVTANDANTKSDYVQSQLDNIITNGDSSAEVVQARKGKTTLRERLDDEYNEVTSQLAQKALKITTLTEQGIAFDTSEDNHVSWLHCNVSYDETDDSWFVVYNAQPTHSITQSKTYARKKYRNGDFSSKIVIASRLAEGISAKCQSSGIAVNGDYLAVVAHIDPNNFLNILGTYVYRSKDKGLTWDNGTKIGVEGVPIIGYSGDISGFRTLSNGRIILWGWDVNKKSFAVYSDDNGYNWLNAPISGNPYYVTEPTFVELDDGTIIGYARDDVTDGEDHIVNPKPAWFLKSTTGGTSWETPVKSTSILDMSNNNCAFIKHGELVEIIYGSRYLHKDGYGSIYQAITTEEDLKNDMWGESIRIARVNGIPANLSGDGDSGYYGAATAKDGTSLVFYYNGTKTSSKIYYLKGNYNNPTIFRDKDEIIGFKGVRNDVDGQIVFGDYSGTKGQVLVKRLVGSNDLFIDLTIASNGQGWLSLGENVGGVDTILSRVILNQNGKISLEKGLDKLLLKGDAPGTFRDLSITMTLGNIGQLTLQETVSGNNVLDLYLGDGAIVPVVDKTTDLGSITKRFKSAYFSNILGVPTFPTTGRPTTDLLSGAMYYDLTLNRPVYRNSTNNGWLETLGKFVTSPPASKTANGFRGDFSADANFFYVCYADNSWIRVAKDSAW